MKRKYSSEKFWHRYPADRTFLEKIARRFLLPNYTTHLRTFVSWSRHDARMQRSFPVRWFFRETVPQAWSDWVVRPKNVFFQFFRFRFKDRYHVVKTGLKPGYWDSDTRMLHAAFNLLKDYVEIELAAINSAANDPFPSGSSKKFYQNLSRFRRKRTRNPESGISYLDWEIEHCDGHSYNTKSMTQGNIAQEKKFLYLWWTKYRPQRIDIYSHPLIWGEGKDESKYQRFEHHLIQQLETFYEEEDEEMLARLVRIRTFLWT